VLAYLQEINDEATEEIKLDGEWRRALQDSTHQIIDLLKPDGTYSALVNGLYPKVFSDDERNRFQKVFRSPQHTPEAAVLVVLNELPGKHQWWMEFIRVTREKADSLIADILLGNFAKIHFRIV